MNQLALELFAPNPVETAIRAALDNYDQSCPPYVFKTATEAYSADKIGQNQPVRTFRYRGFLYTTTGTAGAACPGGATPARRSNIPATPRCASPTRECS